MSQNIGGKFAKKKKDPLKPFYPIIGLIVMVAAGAIGIFAAPFAIDMVSSNLPTEIMQRNEAQLTILSFSISELELMFAAMIFFVVVGFLGFVFAIFAPKPPKEVSEKALMADKRAMDMERKRLKRRKSAMRKRMKQGTKDMDEF